MSTTSLADIQAQIAQLEVQAAKLRSDAAAEHQKLTAGVVQEVRAKIAEYGLTARDLGLSTAAGKSRRTGAIPKATSGPVFRGPNGETWTGGTRGRKPRWLTQALATGKTLEELAA
jgi:DNA-binding protein H-NS